VTNCSRLLLLFTTLSFIFFLFFLYFFFVIWRWLLWLGIPIWLLFRFFAFGLMSTFILFLLTELWKCLSDFFLDSRETIMRIWIFDKHGLRIVVMLLQLLLLTSLLLHSFCFLLSPSSLLLLSQSNILNSLILLCFQSRLFLTIEVEPVRLALGYNNLNSAETTMSSSLITN